MTMPQSITNEAQPNLGPNELFLDEQTSFLLARGDLYTLQLYIEAALNQPTTEEDLRKNIGRASGIAVDDSEALKSVQLPPDSTQLLQTFATIKRHCLTWKTKTFPAMVALAGDIVQYNFAVPEYYVELIKLVPALRRNDTDAQANLRDLVTDLAAIAHSHATNAAKAAQKAQEFYQETLNDGAALQQHASDYQERLGDNGQQTRDLRKKYAVQKTIYDQALEEYNHAVVVAATTPSYAWTSIFPPFGPIPIIIAVVIAGVYGDRATKAKQRMDVAVAQMKTIAQQMDQNSQFAQAVSSAAQQVQTIEHKLQAAIPVIQRIQNSWEMIGAELAGIERMLTEQIATVTPTKIQALANKAIGEWKIVAKQADMYRLNAFIDVQNPNPPAA